MAERRMFTDKITESDAFLDMPLSSQCLYFHLCMNADDDGFVKNRKRIQKMVGASEDDYKLLVLKVFVVPFESGVIVIKHWRMHNLIRKDRYKPTEYIEEKAMLFLKENGAYTLDEKQGKPLIEIANENSPNNVDNLPTTAWQPNDNQMAPQVSIGKDIVSIGKDKLLAKDIKEKITNACIYAQGTGRFDKPIELIIKAMTFACQNEKAETYAGKQRDADYWISVLDNPSLPNILAKVVNSLMAHEPEICDEIRYTLSIIASENDKFGGN